MSSTRKTEDTAEIVSKIAIEPTKQHELWNAIEQRIEMVAQQNTITTPPAKTKRNRSIWGQFGAAVTAVALLVVSIPTAIHHYQTLNRNPSRLSSTNQTKPRSGSTISNRVVEKYYARSHQTIVKVSNYPKYHAEIVEYRVAPTVADGFDWWDLTTGLRYPLPGRPNYLKLDKVLSTHKVVFMATGANSESPGLFFPYYVVAHRPNDSAQFTETNEAAYLPIQQPVSIGDGKVESLSQLSMTSDGITIGFSALKGQEGNFAAGAYGAPETSISFVSSKNEVIVTFVKTTLGMKQSQIVGVHKNSFVQSVNLQSKGNDVQVILHLSSKTKFYTGTIDHKSSTPTLKLQFANTDQKVL